METSIDSLLSFGETDYSSLAIALATFLRVEDNRENAYLRERFHQITDLFNGAADGITDHSSVTETNLQSLLKIFINFVAYNDYNRSLLTNEETSVLRFHHNLKKILSTQSVGDELKSLVITFLRNLTLYAPLPLQFVSETGYPQALLNYTCSLDTAGLFVSTSDLLRDLSEETAPDLKLSELESYAERVNKLIVADSELWSEYEEDDEEEEHPLIICTGLIANLSKSSNFQYGGSTIHSKIYDLSETLFLRLAKNDIVKKAQRNLFDTIGQITADPRNTNEHELAFNISVIEADHYQSPYSIASSFITIGNYINSKTKKLEFLSELSDANSFYQNSFDKFVAVSRHDTVLLQALHFFTQAWDVEFADGFFEHWERFVLLFDMYFSDEVLTYYQPISIMMCRFFTKLIGSLHGEKEAVSSQLELEETVHYNKQLSELIRTKYEIFERTLAVIHKVDNDASKVSVKHQLKIAVFKYITKLISDDIKIENEEHLRSLVQLLLSSEQQELAVSEGVQAQQQQKAGEVPFDYLAEKLKGIAILVSSPSFLKCIEINDLVPALQSAKDIVIDSRSNPSSAANLLGVLANNLKFIGAKLQDIADPNLSDELKATALELLRL